LFNLPARPDGRPLVYFNGNSLGLMPKGARELVEEELEDWATLGVEAHFEGRTPWFSYHEVFREAGARLVGAVPGEVVMMNSLTVNLHLMMATFYRPSKHRHRILVEDSAFPSDTYAVRSQIEWHGFDPEESLLVARPRPGETTLRTEDVLELIESRGPSIALVMIGGVQYFTGQLFDMQAIAASANRMGCVVGFDLAHAAGNVPLRLHDWNVDFGVWCSYKYLNAGPGAIAGCFVHERHGNDPTVGRLAGWWGNDPATRFRMHLEPRFVPRKGADGWQVSNPPILAMAPLRASLEIFDRAGMDALRARSEEMTARLLEQIDAIPQGRFEVITPRNPAERGCQISLRVLSDPKGLFRSLAAAGVVGDFREPDVVRVAPVPLYNTLEEIDAFAEVLREHVAGR
jgi:kynureninase